MSREELLRVSSEGEQEPFLSLIKQHESKDNNFNLTETIESLSSKQLEELWTSLNNMCTVTLLSFSADDDEEGQEELKMADKVLQGIILAAMSTIQQKDVVIPGQLLETAVILHGILPNIPDDMPKLQSAVAHLCEFWWTHKLRGREAVAVNTISYYLEKSLLPNAPNADIKRVWFLHECLHQVQLDNESSEKLKSLLKGTVASTKYLKIDEGKRFLSFLFGLSPNFIESLHMTIKNQIPYCSTSLLPLYGEVYFRAWRVASGQYLEKIENKCIQDLMYRAIHAIRGGSNSMASRLKKLLGYIHKQKKQQGVDEMLLRLYEPFLWRSLKVANGLVRTNAVGILIDAFPLVNPEASNEQMDTLLQKQFDTLLTLLEDPVVIVRASTIHGVCHIMSVYWELIPKAMIHTFILKLLQDLAWDAASADVRTAVLTGLAHLLDNHLSHPMLKNILPEMKNLLHDTSEMVRIAFMEILLRVKRIKTLKYWSIAPMEHLLARLELDDAPVCKRIVELTFNSYIPTDKPPEAQLDRIVYLIQMNRGGARKFFKYAQLHLSPSSVAKLMILLCRCVIQCVRKETKKEKENNDSEVGSQSEEDDKTENEDDESGISAKDTALMVGLLESIIILWEGSGKIFKGSDNELKKNLDQAFSRALPEMFKYFQDQEVCACLILLAGFLPANTIPTFSRSLLSKLKGMNTDNTPEEYGPLIESMCKWQKSRDLLELIADWFEASIVIKDPNESAKKSNTSKNKGVRFDAPVEAKPQLGLAYIRYITGHALCRDLMLNRNRDDLITVVTLLKDIMKCIDTRLQTGQSTDEILTDDVLVDLFEEYLRLEILLHKPNSDEDAIKAMEKVVKWSTQNLLPLLKQRRQHKRRLLTQSEATMASQEGTMMGDTTVPTLSTTLLSTTLKRGPGGDAVEYGNVDLATQLIKKVLAVTGDMCLVGIGNYALAGQLADFTVNLLSTEDSVRLLPEVANLMYQITELILSRQRRTNDPNANAEPDGNNEENESGTRNEEDEEVLRSDMVPDMLKKVMSMLSHLVRAKKELAERVLPTLKPAITEMVISYYHHQSLNQTLCKDVMSIIVAGVVAEMRTTIKKDNFLDRVESISALPLLSSFILSILSKRTSMTSLFTDELLTCIDSGVIETMEGLLGILHVLFTLNKSKSKKNNVKDCLMAVQKQFEGMESPDAADDNSPYKDLHQTTKTLLKDVMTDVGMVA